MPSPQESNLSSLLNWVDTEVRGRYAETDQMGVVYYANYLAWFEVGRTELCRKMGVNYRDLEKQTQSYLVVAEAECRYHSPARYDDLLIIRTCVESLRKRTLSFLYQIRRSPEGSVIASGRTVHVVVDKNGRPITLPAMYRDFLGPKSSSSC